MRCKVRMLLLASVVTILAVTPLAFPQEKGLMSGGNKEARPMFDDSVLPAEKREQLQAVREQFRSESKDLRAAMREKRQALMQELDKEPLDTAAVNKLSGELKELSGKMIDHRVEGIIAIRQIVGPGQFQTKSFFEHRHRGQGRKFSKEE